MLYAAGGILVLLLLIWGVVEFVAYRRHRVRSLAKASRRGSIPVPTAPRAINAPPQAPPPSIAMEIDASDVTMVTLVPADLEEPTLTGTIAPLTTVPIFSDDDAAVDEPTRPMALILVSAAGQSDVGRRRKQNEDSYLQMADLGLYAVADGMGGYAGGEIASKIAADTIGQAFRTSTFEGTPQRRVPPRGSELALAIQMANLKILEAARVDVNLANMGTTVVAARFSPNKQRVYIGHVGDSRCYRARGSNLKQLTTDHTMAAEGMVGRQAAHLSRAVGISSRLKIDLIIDKPLPGDRYVLCSDGLTKMTTDTKIAEILKASSDPQECVEALIAEANAQGGKDNVTVLLIEVMDPSMLRNERQPNP